MMGDRCREPRAEPGLLASVVGNFRQKLTPCGRYEPGAFHRLNRRASAKTSSAG